MGFFDPQQEQAQTTGTFFDPSAPPVISQGQPKSKFSTWMDGLTHLLNISDSPEESAARASNALVYSKMFKISPSIAYDYHDEISNHIIKNGGDVPFKAPTKPKGTVSERVAKGVKEGAQESVIGLATTLATGGKMDETNDLEDQDKFVHFSKMATTMLADLPLFVLGGMPGESLVAKMAGGMGLTSEIRQTLIDSYNGGEIKDFGDFVDRYFRASAAGIKGAITGGVTAATGGAVPTGMKLMSEWAAMTTASTLLEGRIPTARDVTDNALGLGFMHMGVKALDILKPRLESLYTKQGIHPNEAVEKVISRIPEEKRANPSAEDITTAIDGYAEELKQHTSLRPAVVYRGEVITGDVGDDHVSIMKSHGIGPDEPHERIFVKPDDDDTANRRDSREWLENNDESTYTDWANAKGENSELHSRDVLAAKGIEPNHPEPIDEGETSDSQPGKTKEETQASKKSFSIRVKPEGTDVTGVKKEVVEAERKEEGKPPVQTRGPVSDEDIYKTGRKAVESGQIDPRSLAEDISKNPRPLRDEEIAALLYDRMALRNQRRGILDQIEQEPDEYERAKKMDALENVENAIEMSDNATAINSEQWGHAGRIMQLMIREDYSIENINRRLQKINKGRPIPEELQKALTKWANEINNNNDKIDKHIEKKTKEKAQKTVDNLKKEEERQTRRTNRTVKKEQLDSEFDDLLKSLNSRLNRVSANPMLNPETIAILGKLARNRVIKGIVAIEQIVDDIHAHLTAMGSDISKREIRDGISGYGKTIEMSKDKIDVALREARAQGRLISGLEDVMNGKAPERSGLQRGDQSDRVRELTRQIHQTMREKGVDVGKSPEKAWKTAMDAVKTNLKNEITDLDKQIKAREKTKKPFKKLVYDADAEKLRATRDEKKRLLNDIDEINQEMKKERTPDKTPEIEQLEQFMAKTEKDIARAEKSLQKQIEEKEQMIKDGKLKRDQVPSSTPDTPELVKLRAKRDELQAKIDEARKAAKPATDPLKALKTRQANRNAELEERLRTGDYTKDPKPKPEYDEELQKLQQEGKRLKGKVDDKIRQQAWENRTPEEKTMHFLVKWRRAALLANSAVLVKLGAAAGARLGITPIEDMVGEVMAVAPGISQIAAKAPRHGGVLRRSVESRQAGKDFRTFIENTLPSIMEEIKQTAKTGKSSIDVMNAKRGQLPPEALDFFGHLHGAEKYFPKRVEFLNSIERRAQFAFENGDDLENPAVQTKICSLAYDDANRAIFMQDNIVSDGYRMLLGYFDKRGMTGKVTKAVAQTLLPIVKIPTNFAGEVAEYSAIPSAVRTARIIFQRLSNSDALKNITPEQADNIMRGYKKGSIGLAVFALGYYNAQNMGGFYQQGERRHPGDVDPGEIRIPALGVDIPALVLHHPLIEMAQMGATAYRVQEYYHKRMKPNGRVAGLSAAGVGALENVPFFEEPVRIHRSMQSPDAEGKFAGEFARTLLPFASDLSRLGRFLDEDSTGHPVVRKPAGAVDMFKLGIPGLRKQVPINEDAMKARSKMDFEDKIFKSIPHGKELQDTLDLQEYAKHLKIDQLAEGLKNASPDQAAIVSPIFAKKLTYQSQKGTISAEKLFKYSDILTKKGYKGGNEESEPGEMEEEEKQ